MSDRSGWLTVDARRREAAPPAAQLLLYGP
jgi:hypothetical protein